MLEVSRRAFALGAGAFCAGLSAAEAGPKLKVYVFVDMEGVSGVSSSEQTIGSRRSEGCLLMAGDINACVEGCFAAGATEVVVRDGHWKGVNVDPALIDPRAKLVQGSTPGVRFKDLDGSEALILLGYHAKALTPGALLAHSYSSATIQGLWLNGREVGEIGLDAAIAAEHGVPVVMVSGCDKVAAEAREWIPGVVACAVKKSTGVQGAECPPAEETRRLIREKAEEAVRKRQAIRPAAVAHPVTLRRDYLPKESLRTYDPAFKPVENPRRAEKTGASAEQVFLGKE